ncbi:actinia tenebrosa protease inhibitors-like [Amblyomma americanum]
MKSLVLLALCCSALAISGAEGAVRHWKTKRPQFPDEEVTAFPLLSVGSTETPFFEARIDVRCLEPKYPGPCYGYFPRYYFNNATKTCEQFIYGGCQGNGNNFETLEECQNACRYVPGVPSKEESFFSEVTDIPPRMAASLYEEEDLPFPRDWDVSARIDVACLEPKYPGPCKGYFPRYYFNVTTKTCEQFIYGGCQANGNNFETLQECQRRCRYVAGPTTQLEGVYHHKKPSEKRPKTVTPLPRREVWATHLPDVEARIDVACLDPKYPGPCLGYFPRYYFNVTTKTCEQFIYGGCQANGNNFETLLECQRRCAYIRAGLYKEESFSPEEPSDVAGDFELVAAPRRDFDLPYISARVDVACREPKYPGPCKGYFPRYYYDNTTKTCKQFIYGGCQGNGNNFGTLEECKNRCWASLSQAQIDIIGTFDPPFWPFKPPQVCTYPKDSGPCLAYMPMWYFNTLTKTCEEFVYGGCGGNENKFRTFADCDNKCKKFLGVIPRA